MQSLFVGTVAWHLGLVVVGLFLLGAGYRSYTFGRLVRDTPTSKPGAVAAGRVETQGTAQPDGEPIAAPFTGEECVYLDWTLEQRDGDEWVERAAETRVEPFYLAGENGRVLVRADKHPDIEELPWEYDSLVFDDHKQLDAVLQGARDDGDNPATTVNPATTTNPAVTTDPAVTDDGSGQEYQFVKRLLPPGTNVYVFGSAELGHDRGELGIETDETTGQFVISRGSELWVSKFAYYVGLTAMAAGVLFLLWGGAVLTGLLAGTSLWLGA